MEGVARPLFWNVPFWAELALYALIAPVVIFFVGGTYWRVRKWRLGRPEPGADSILRAIVGRLKELANWRRLKEFVQNAFFQWRLSKDPFATVMHLAVFWGMVVLFIGTALATIDQDFTNLPFDFQFLQGGVYCLFELMLDVFGVVLILGLAMAAYRRYLVRPERLKTAETPISKWDRFPFLLVLFLIAVTGFVAEGLRIAEAIHIDNELVAAKSLGTEENSRVLEKYGMEERFHLLGEERRRRELDRITDEAKVFPAAAWAPVGYGLAQVFAPLSAESISLLHRVTWWVHALVAFTLIGAIPFTKAFHLISSPLNLFFGGPPPGGRVVAVLDTGVQKISDFTWRQLLQVDSCTWCGKCHEVCPAQNTGFPLSPRDIVQKLDAVLIRAAAGNGPASAQGESPADPQAPAEEEAPADTEASVEESQNVHGSVISPDELWACCACRACEEICPVLIEHPRMIIDMRRYLLDQGALGRWVVAEIDSSLQDALMHTTRYGNSFGQSARKRAQWTKPLEFQIKDARKEEVEYLWFVGDYASYDQRAREVTQMIARIFHHLQLDVGILYDKEQNAGNDARRVGEEGLFELLREKNCRALEKATFRQVVTTDPHTYNTLKNEYKGEVADPVLAGRPVIHYTELFDRLIREGKLRFQRQLGSTATYHDPCYLGRYNGVYEAPRNVLKAAGVTLVEMPRHGEQSFCCGAGGGRIWMKDTPGVEERPAENRIHEALAVPGVEYFVVACPKDLVMFQDAVKTVGAEGRLKVVDLGELVLEAVGIGEEVQAEA